VQGDDFRFFYLQEVATLEDELSGFSKTYPDIASNLEVGVGGILDPHVKQLVQAVAFIAARLRIQLNRIPGNLVYEILQSIGPELTEPVPCMTIIQLTPSKTKVSVPLAFEFPGNVLKVQAGHAGRSDAIPFLCATADIKLWFLRFQTFWRNNHVDRTTSISSSEWLLNSQAPSGSTQDFVIHLSHETSKIPQGGPGELTFFISGSVNRALAAIDALWLGCVSMRMEALDGSWGIDIPKNALHILGFELAHRLLPCEGMAEAESALMAEYVRFPRRFCFFKLTGLSLPKASQAFCLVFKIKEAWVAAIDSVKDFFMLNCVPAVNLARRTQVVVPINNLRAAVKIPGPGAPYRMGEWAIYKVNKVTLSDGDVRQVLPRFCHGAGRIGEDVYFWKFTRQDDPVGHGSYSMISLERPTPDATTGDGAFSGVMRLALDVYDVFCHVPEQLEVGAQLQIADVNVPCQARIEIAPTTYLPPLLPSTDNLGKVLNLMRWRAVDTSDVVKFIGEYMQFRYPGLGPVVRHELLALLGLQREMIAFPMKSNTEGRGGFSIGYRYYIRFSSGQDGVFSKYIFSSLIKTIILRFHDASYPIECMLVDEGDSSEAHLVAT
jgi:hypothetical protein